MNPYSIVNIDIELIPFAERNDQDAAFRDKIYADLDYLLNNAEEYILHVVGQSNRLLSKGLDPCAVYIEGTSKTSYRVAVEFSCESDGDGEMMWQVEYNAPMRVPGGIETIRYWPFKFSRSVN